MLRENSALLGRGPNGLAGMRNNSMPFDDGLAKPVTKSSTTGASLRQLRTPTPKPTEYRQNSTRTCKVNAPPLHGEDSQARVEYVLGLGCFAALRDHQTPHRPTTLWARDQQ